MYVPDGRAAEIKIFRGSDYGQIGSVKLLRIPIRLATSRTQKRLYVTNGGGGPHLEYAPAVSFLVFLLKASYSATTGSSTPINEVISSCTQTEFSFKLRVQISTNAHFSDRRFTRNPFENLRSRA
jgi:hypothetical protein